MKNLFRVCAALAAMMLLACCGTNEGEEPQEEQKPRGPQPGDYSFVMPADMKVSGEAPDWFLRGVDAALLAPTALNQQRFTLSLKKGNRVKAKAGIGPWTKIDLGIVRYHFEIGAGIDNFKWE